MNSVQSVINKLPQINVDSVHNGDISVENLTEEQNPNVNNQGVKNTRQNQSNLEPTANIINKKLKILMNGTPLECSWWSRHPTTTAVGAVCLLVSASITIGVLIVYLTISKAPILGIDVSSRAHLVIAFVMLRCARPTFSDPGSGIDFSSLLGAGFVRHCQVNFRKTLENPLDLNYNPRSVAIGDFNSDTWLDFVVTNRAVNNISVFLGSTNSTFGQPTTYPTGSHSLPDKTAVADLNNDQRLDIIVAYFGINSVGIFLGMGDGTFVSHTTVPTGSSRPIWIHISHLDNDTSLDLVTADYGTDSITLYSGDGTGNFSYRMGYPTGYDSSPVSVISADLNNDNHLDLVVANSGTNNVVIFFGQSNGEFSNQKVLPTGIHTHPNSVVAGHFNNDKLLDIAVANYGTNNISVFWNMGNGTFLEQTTYMLENASPYFIDVADINQDKQPDLIAINRGTNNIGILLGRGSGNFSRPITFVTGSLSSISAAIGDLNKDSLPDIVIINNETNSITISFTENEGFQPETRYSNFFGPPFNQGTETCPTPPPSYGFMIGRVSLPIGDFNNDGHLDVIVSKVNKVELVLFLGWGNGSFTYQTIYRMNQTQTKLAVADFNGDTRLDIVLAYNGDQSGRVYVDLLLGDGNGSFTKQTTYKTGCEYVKLIVAEDLNKDKLVDIVVVDNLGIICVLLAIGNGSFAKSRAYLTGDFIDSIAIGDFNNDTKLDIVVSRTSSTKVRVFVGYGNGSFANQPIRSTVSPPWSIDVTDFNNDTISDIVIAEGSDRYNVSVLLGFGNGSFHAPLTFFTGKGPMDATVGDFNNDHRMDIVVVNAFDNNMRIFLGYGNGTFANSSTYSTGPGPTLVIVADFNEDGRSDIMVANDRDTSISVFIFSLVDFTSKSISSGLTDASRLQCVTTDDFNNDNILDMVVVNYGTKNIALLLGLGDGSFTRKRATQLDWNSNPQSITIADFNKDNRLDLAVANSGTHNIDMLLGDDKGALIRQNNDGYSLNRPPLIVVSDDFDHDGHSEIVVAYDNTDNIDILVVYDPGNFTDQITYPTGFQLDRVATGDFNQDKILDLVVTFRSNDKIGILLGHGDGSFTNQTTYDSVNNPWSVAVGHFNNDSHLDIVVASFNDENVGVLLGYGNGSFAKQKTYPVGSDPYFIVVGDFNNDTFSDIVVSTYDDSGIKILLNYGNGSFSDPRSLQTQTSVTTLAIGDVNNDMFMDIITTDSNNQFNVFFGCGNGSFSMPVTSSVGFYASSLAVGDFNNDAWLDIVRVTRVEVNIFVGYGNGSFRKPTTYSIGCYPHYVAVADLNNDNQLDIVTSHFKGDNISVLLGNGNGSFTALAKYRTGASSSQVVIGDFNNDNRMDILVPNSDSDNLTILLGKFNQVFKHQITLITDHGSSPRALATGDFNNDTHPDIVVVNSGTNSVSVFLGHGNGAFSAQISSPTVSSASLIAVGHLNNDTHLDVVVVYFIESTIGIHLGNGNGSFINHTTYSTGVQAQPRSISVADFDNDAILDIIIVNYDASNVLVFLGYGDGSFTATTEIRIGYGAHPFSATVGDYNNDKKLDFAVANNGRDNLEIYLQTC